MQPHEPCPCGSGQRFGECCDKYLSGAALPERAEQLMRSRYTAYVMGDEAYLLRTWHPSTRPPSLDLAQGLARKWLGLKIRRVSAGGPDAEEGSVSFVARFKTGGRAERLEEDSRFVREAGRWFYLDGEFHSG